MTENRPCREDLLHWINVASFAVNETQLFLDTHPCNTEAMKYFEEMKSQRTAALNEYAKHYGPLTMDTIHTPVEHWKWIHSPWTWQEGGC